MSARLLLAAAWLKPIPVRDEARTARAWDDGRDAFVAAQSGSRRFTDRAAAAGPPVLSPAGRALLVALLATPLLAVDPAAGQAYQAPQGQADPAVTLPSVEVRGSCSPARDVDCANRALQAAARQAQAEAQAGVDTSVPSAGSSGHAVGVSGQAGASLRLGPALGTSVHRPAPPRAPSAPRPGGPS